MPDRRRYLAVFGDGVVRDREMDAAVWALDDRRPARTVPELIDQDALPLPAPLSRLQVNDHSGTPAMRRTVTVEAPPIVGPSPSA
jgi:hypothetical protein